VSGIILCFLYIVSHDILVVLFVHVLICPGSSFSEDNKIINNTEEVHGQAHTSHDENTTRLFGNCPPKERNRYMISKLWIKHYCQNCSHTILGACARAFIIAAYVWRHNFRFWFYWLVLLCLRFLCAVVADQKKYIHTYIHTTHALSPKGKQRHLRYYSETPTFYQNFLAIRNTADVTGGKPFAV
jgi:hypothetical protein